MKNQNGSIVSSSSTIAYNSASSVATDASGNIYTAGCSGNTETGGGYFTHDYGFLRKCDSTGTKLWEQQFAITNAKQKNSGYMPQLALDGAGNVCITGTMGGNYFLNKYGPDGTLKWTQSSSTDQYHGVTTDSNGNVYVQGYESQKLTFSKYASSGMLVWKNSFDLPQGAGEYIAVDSSGNIYLVGWTQAELNKQKPEGTYVGFIVKYDASANLKWTVLKGKCYTYFQGVTIDDEDNLILTGVDFSPANPSPASTPWKSDAFVTKYDTHGNLQWAQQLGASGSGQTYTQAFGAALDLAGNIYFTGVTDSGLNGNTQSGLWDLILAKYDTTGNLHWVEQLGAAGGALDGNAIAINGDGNIIIAADTNVAIGGNTMKGSEDALLLKYTGNEWTSLAGAASAITIGYGLAMDSSNNVYISGKTTGGLGGNTCIGMQDAFLSQYSSSGTAKWTVQLGVAGATTAANSTATDTSGNVYLAGVTSGSLAGNTLTGQQDAFLSQYGSSGTAKWIVQLGAASAITAANGTATGTSGNVYLVGATSGGLAGNTLTGQQDAFLSQYGSSGTANWTVQLGAVSATTAANGVATDTSGNVYLVGSATGSLAGSNTLTGFQDLFVSKYDSSGTLQWTKQQGVAGQYSAGTALAIGSDGSVFVVGWTGSIGDIIDQWLVLVSRYDASGTLKWTNQFGSSNSTSKGFGISVSGSNLYITGASNGGINQQISIGTQDGFCVELDSCSGQIIRNVQELGISQKKTGCTGVCVDASGNAYVTGYTFGGLSGIEPIGPINAFLVKYASPYLMQWTQQFSLQVPSQAQTNAPELQDIAPAARRRMDMMR